MDHFDEALEAVLTKAKYGVLTGRILDWRQSLFDAVRRIIERIIEKLIGSELAQNSAAVDAAVSILLALGAVFIVIVVSFAAYWALRMRKKHFDGSMEDIFSGIDPVQTYEDLIASAGRLAASGQLRDAIRYRYISVLWILNQTGLVTIFKTKTNGQLKREIQKNAPGFYVLFSAIVETFNLAWFGHKEISSDQYIQYSCETDNLIKEALAYEKPV